ncbi:D-alanyl-D-alanine carboxypeptidase family protein [Alteribacillus sp. YIM 98480]|uniref:M15 family metallopeptidase n=1 Tax=Alteribacillus sp. YIM 98480 TaxID=2606599 RepID=UPI001E5A811D|nr:M15 family metallopeptidase [Alteribacillus sp. YIM 98480]
MKNITMLVASALIITGCSSNTDFNEDKQNTEEEEVTEEEAAEPVAGDENESREKEEDTEEQAVEAPQLNEKGELTKPESEQVLVNREYRLPEGYEPDDLTVPDIPFPFEEDHPKKQIREPAVKPLEELFDEASEEGLQLYAISGYRSYDRQEAIFAANAAEDGEEEANQYSAKPGQSEHQSGLAMDVSSPSADLALTDEFGETPEGQWLKDNAHRFGFIIRYPEDKTDITGFQYEPWHLRYVGKEAAETMHEKDQTLEEYYGVEE